jgi:hypothetical protein
VRHAYLSVDAHDARPRHLERQGDPDRQGRGRLALPVLQPRDAPELIVPVEDVGDPISYFVLEPGTPVYAEGGVAVGTVRRVLADEQEDVFDGLVIRTADGDRFADRDQIGPIHQRAVVLLLSADACRGLPEPSENPAVMRDDPAEGRETSVGHIEDMARAVWNRITGNY